MKERSISNFADCVENGEQYGWQMEEWISGGQIYCMRMSRQALGKKN
jgi:hypothetical protein